MIGDIYLYIYIETLPSPAAAASGRRNGGYLWREMLIYHVLLISADFVVMVGDLIFNWFLISRSTSLLPPLYQYKIDGERQATFTLQLEVCVCVF